MQTPRIHEIGRRPTRPLNLTCAAGEFDIVFDSEDAPSGYEDLVEDSEVLLEGF